MILSTKTVTSVISLLLNEAKSSLNDWNEKWNGHVGDLSAPEYHSIISKISTLTTIYEIIMNGDRRVYETEKPKTFRNNRGFRRRNLFKLIKEKDEENKTI